MESNIEAQRTEFYKKVEEIKAARNAYFADLEEKPLTYLKDYTVEKIQPSEMKVGDLMHQEGCIYKITKIKVFEDDDPVTFFPAYHLIPRLLEEFEYTIENMTSAFQESPRIMLFYRKIAEKLRQCFEYRIQGDNT